MGKIVKLTESSVKTLRKLIPYNYDYTDKFFEFRDDGRGKKLDSTCEISISRHPRRGILLRSTEIDGESATHTFYGLSIQDRTTIYLLSYSQAFESPLMPLESAEDASWIGYKAWSVSTESASPRFPNFGAMDISKWKIDAAFKRALLSNGLEEFSALMYKLEEMIKQDRSR